MLNCWFNRRHLAPYLDDELSIPRRIAVDHHLANCHRCARVANRERVLSRAVRRAAEDPIDANLAERLRVSGDMVLSRVAAEREVARDTGVRRLTEYPHLVWAAGAACAVTLVCALLAASMVASVPQPGSLAARLLSLSNPGSNENPLGLRMGMVTPQLSPDAQLLSRPDPIPRAGAVHRRDVRTRADAGGNRLRPGGARIERGGAAQLVRPGRIGRRLTVRAGGIPRRPGRGEHGLGGRRGDDPG